MKVVGARLDAGVDDRAGRVTELRAGIGGLDIEFLQSIRWGLHVVAGAIEEVDGVRIVVDAIQDEVVFS